MDQGSFQDNLARLRQELAKDREKISSETQEIYKEIATSAPPPANSVTTTDPASYIGVALRAERKLGRLAERLSHTGMLENCRFAASLLEACDAVTAEGRGATPRRLLQFMAYDGDSSSHYENLIGAMDVFSTCRKPAAPAQEKVTSELVRTIATRTSLRSRNWLSSPDRLDWHKIISDRQIPCPLDTVLIARFCDQMNDHNPENGIMAAADTLYMALKWLYELEQHYDALAHDHDMSPQMELETDNPQAIYWNRTCRLLIPYLVAHFCDSILLPLMCGTPVTNSLVKLRPLFAHNAPAENARPHTLAVILGGIERLDQTEKQVRQQWRKAEKLSADGRGSSLAKITSHLFQHGTICVADIVELCDLTPQAAHYQLKRLLESGLISRGPKGKVGGHYFLDFLLHM